MKQYLGIQKLKLLPIILLGIGFGSIQAGFFDRLSQKRNDFKVCHPVLDSYLTKSIQAGSVLIALIALEQLLPKSNPKTISSACALALASAYVISPWRVHKKLPDKPLIDGTSLVNNKLILTQPTVDNEKLPAFRKAADLAEKDPLKLLLLHTDTKNLYDKKVFEQFRYFDAQAAIVKENEQRKKYASAYLNYALNYVKQGKQFIENKSRELPIFLLDECQGTSCDLSRFKNPARAAFEEDVAQIILNQFTHKKKENYVSFGSGELFQDFLIINKAIKKGALKLNVFFIDPVYKEYIAIHRAQAIPQEHLHIAQSTNAFQVQNERFKQLIRWFQVVHKNAEVQFFIYDSLDSYMNDVKTNKALIADVYVASDLYTQARETYQNSPYESFMDAHGMGFLLHNLIVSNPPDCSVSCCAIAMPLDFKLPSECPNNFVGPTAERKRYLFFKNYSYKTKEQADFTAINRDEELLFFEKLSTEQYELS